jgi:hypothetical protein
MSGRMTTRNHRGRALALLLFLVSLLAIGAPVFADKKYAGRWVMTITIPESPGSRDVRSFTVNVEASPRENSLHGRMTITDAENRTVGGVWRQVNKKIFITYELPCAGDSPCATLVMNGKMKSSNTKIKKGDVVVMWDTPADRNPALFDTSNGSFSAEKILQ